MKFCQVSRNSFSDRFWKCRLSILKNKKYIFIPKTNFKVIVNIKAKKLCLLTQFSEAELYIFAFLIEIFAHFRRILHQSAFLKMWRSHFWKKIRLIYKCNSHSWRLVLLQVPKYFGLVKNFWARPKTDTYLYILCYTKRWFPFSKSGFSAGAKVIEEALNAIKFLEWLKKFGPAQNILGPVKGQGISIIWISLVLI